MMHRPNPAAGRLWLAACALLAVFLLQIFFASLVKSPVADEPGHISAGLSYVETGLFRANLQHPPLIKELSGLVLKLSGLHMPAGAATRELLNGNSAYQWEVGNQILTAGDLDRNLLRARLPMMAIAVLLGVLLFVWGRELVGAGAALGAVFLFSFDPTLMAHSYLVTTDVGCATFTILLLLAVWKYVERPGLTRLALCGLAMGAALTAKFSAIFLLPVVGVLLLAAVWFSPRDQAAAGGQRTPSPDDRCPCGSGRKYKNCHQAERQGKRRAIDYRLYLRSVGAFGAMVALALVVVEAVYGFHGGIGLYVQGLRLVNADRDPNHLAFLAGQMGPKFLSYFAAALLLKEPAAVILLAGYGVFLVLWKSDLGILQKLFLLLPPAVLFVAYTSFAANLGIRYIIPVLPFAYLAGGVALARLWGSGSIAKRAAAGALCTWLLVAAAGIYPDHLSYFNEFACVAEPAQIGLDGGSRCGTLWLDDSNVDWGQGLKQLKDWLAVHAKGRTVRLGYFGSFAPEAYGFPIEKLNPLQLAEPPSPGLYAVSAHTVAYVSGLIDKYHEGSNWMRTTQPTAIVGHALYIFDIK